MTHTRARIPLPELASAPAAGKPGARSKKNPMRRRHAASTRYPGRKRKLGRGQLDCLPGRLGNTNELDTEHDWHTLRWTGLPDDGEVPSFGDARLTGRAGAHRT
jgi:hypothetical protein